MKKNNYQQPKVKLVEIPRLMDVGPYLSSKEEEPGSLDVKFEEEDATAKGE